MPLPCDFILSANINIPKDEESIKIYPNPFSDHISILTNTKGKIRIMDISGRIIYDSTLSDGVNEISTVQFPRGIFFVEIKNSKNNTQTFKMIKP